MPLTSAQKLSLEHISKPDRLKILTLEDTEKAAQTLLEAFQDDDLANLLFNHVADPEEKARQELEMYKCYVRQHIISGICIGIGESEAAFETVAVWSVPFINGVESFATLMEAGYHELWSMMDSVGRQKVFYGMLPLLHESCDRIISSDSRFSGKGIFTLVYLGSLESARGKGNARLMFNFMFENFIDQTPDSISYLESSSLSNIPIYMKFDFKYCEDITLGDNTNVNSVSGEHYAHMNIMIRGHKGRDWTKDENTFQSKL